MSLYQRRTSLASVLSLLLFVAGAAVVVGDLFVPGVELGHVGLLFVSLGILLTGLCAVHGVRDEMREVFAAGREYERTRGEVRSVR